MPGGDLGRGPISALKLGNSPYLLLERDIFPSGLGRQPALPLPWGELVYPRCQVLPALRISEGSHGASQAPAVLEVVLHGRLLHLQGELGLPGGLARADLTAFLIIPPPVVEGMPVGIPQLRNGVRIRIPELDERLDGNPSLLQAVHAVLP